jgi:hypothetical protein
VEAPGIEGEDPQALQEKLTVHAWANTWLDDRSRRVRDDQNTSDLLADIPVIVISALATANDRVEAKLNRGARGALLALPPPLFNESVAQKSIMPVSAGKK